MIVLASSSPRRKKLIQEITKNYIIDSPNIDENESFLDISVLSMDLAKRKAYEVFIRHPNDTIIACDTIVIYKDKVFGKPKNYQEAYKMLKNLSNHKHIVLSSYTILTKDKEINNTIKSQVYFNKLSEELIDEYIKTGTCFDKAGGYAIQDEKYPLVKKIIGSKNNVIGFPVEEIKKDLIKFNLL